MRRRTRRRQRRTNPWRKMIPLLAGHRLLMVMVRRACAEGRRDMQGSIAIARSRPHLRRRALVLFRTRDLGTERLSRMPTPMGIIEHGAGKSDHVGFAFRDDGFSLLGRGDQSN